MGRAPPACSSFEETRDRAVARAMGAGETTRRAHRYSGASDGGDAARAGAERACCSRRADGVSTSASARRLRAAQAHRTTASPSSWRATTSTWRRAIATTGVVACEARRTDERTSRVLRPDPIRAVYEVDVGWVPTRRPPSVHHPVGTGDRVIALPVLPPLRRARASAAVPLAESPWLSQPAENPAASQQLAASIAGPAVLRRRSGLALAALSLARGRFRA
jgi:hypothetical protein